MTRQDDETSGPRFRVRTFGGLSVEGRDVPVPGVVNQRKRLAFLALLAASGPHGIARDRILLLLWPESTTERARGALYQFLYVVRQAFGEESVIGTDELRLDSSIVGSDVSEYNEAVARGDLVAAADLYTGSFLDAVHVSGAPELERWIEQKRQELARSYQSTLARLATQAMEQGNNARAITFAERLVAADPLSERATVLLMEALAASGDVTAALECARVHASLVRQELDAPVDTSVNALAQRLRSEAKVVPSAGSESPRTRIHESEQEVAAPALAPALVSAPPPRRTRAMAWTLAGAVVLGVAVIAAMRRPRDREKEFVVVADFETAAADSQIANWLTESTRRALSASRSLGAAPDSRVAAARQRLQVSPATRLTVQLARQIAMGDGIRSVVAGSLKSFGGSYAISLTLLSAPTGKELALVYKTGIATSQVGAALDTLTRQLREAAGDDLEAIRAQPSVLALTSTSLQAMTNYVAALRLPRDSAARAVALLREAVTLDTAFASALWQLGFFTELNGPTADAEHRVLLARAWSHRDGLTEYERLRVEIAYKLSPNGTTPDREQHIERLRQIVEQYPNAVDAMILAGLYFEHHDLLGAERTYRRVIGLDSMRANGYVGVINTYLMANKIGDARRATDELARRFPRSLDLEISNAQVSYAEGRRDPAPEIRHRAAASASQLAMFRYNHAAYLDLLEGRVAAWRRGMDEKDSLVKMRPSAPGLRRARLLASYWVLDRREQGLGMLDASVAGDSSLRVSLDAAEFYAQLGRPASARAVLAARGVRDLTVYLQGTDTLPASAWIDLAEGRPRDAARKFRESLRFLGGNSPSQTRWDAEIGRAFEDAGFADSAIVAYEHYLNGPPTWDADAFKLVWILEHVAPLYEKRGDRKKAIAAYARIADLWKDADAELQPRVTRARERAAALR